MRCASCGTEAEEGARFCDACGGDLRAAPATRSVPPASHAEPEAVPPPFAYPPRRRPAWWIPLSLWAILSAILVALDVAGSGRVSWSIWPVGFLGVFLVGFPVLYRLEAWSVARSDRRTLK